MHMTVVSAQRAAAIEDAAATYHVKTSRQHIIALEHQIWLTKENGCADGPFINTQNLHIDEA